MIQGIDMYFPPLRDIYEQTRAEMMTSKQKDELSFVDALKGALARVNTNFVEAEDAMRGFLLGKRELPEVLMTLQRANLEFRFAMQVRNKLVETYQEIMRMQSLEVNQKL